MGFWPVVLNVLKNSDVVLLIADARMVAHTLNQSLVDHVESMPGKRLFIVINKSDLVSPRVMRNLKEKYEGAYFVSSMKKSSISPLRDHLVNLSENWDGDKKLRVSFVGYPNVGKSSLINMLVGSVQKVSAVSGTTRSQHWIPYKNIRIMDSPGVIPVRDSSSMVGITASKDPQKLKDPIRTAHSLLNFLKREYPGTIKSVYEVEEDESVFEAIGLKKGHRIRGGGVDEHRTAVRIVTDWQKGLIRVV